jgi:hypothetical protein
MILKGGGVKLTDFGVASIRRATSLSQTGFGAGTVLYMSPEQVRGETADARSDIFSLGVTLYEMLTGNRPFEGEEPGAVIDQILNRQPTPVRGLPAHVCQTLETCLRKDREERFGSARDVVDSLTASGAGPPVTSTAVFPKAEPEPAAHRRPRLARLAHRLRWWLAAAAAVLAVGAVAVLRPGPPSGDGPTTAPEGPPAPRFPPSLKPLQAGVVATSLYSGTGRIGGIASAPDGTLLLAMGSADLLPAGVYVAREGDDCDAGDAYTRPGAPFDTPSGIAVHPDGRVLVADSGAETVWKIASPGAVPQKLTDEVPSPSDVLVAPSGFEGPNVHPGDVLVCAGSSAGAGVFGLYVVDPHTGDARLLVGPPELQNGLLCAAFAPDGTLYAMEDDDISWDGFTIVKVLPEGRIEPFLPNFAFFPQPMTGPIAVHPDTGQVFFAYGSTIYQIPDSGGYPEAYAEGEASITALGFSRDGSSLFAADAGEHVIAKIGACPIEGRLVVSGWLPMPDSDQPVEPGEEVVCYALEGRSDNIVPVSLQGSLSPFQDQLVYVTEDPFPTDRPWERVSHIWKAALDGEGQVNLTESIRPESINCCPLWSPDGRRIAFLHCDPFTGEEPCKTGLDIWVMNADGTDAHPVFRSRPTAGVGSQSFPEHWWSPNGDHLIYRYGVDAPVWRVDLDGTEPERLPIFSGNLSPDGSRIVCERTQPDTVDGEDGVWRQLCLENADGTGMQVLVKHFLRDSDVRHHLDSLPQPEGQREEVSGLDWADDVREWAGPRRIRWSPRGDRVAFLAAFEFDPAGPQYKFQVEVWIYELDTHILTRLTDNTEAENNLSWRGPNTYPANRQVTVGNTTVVFSEVSAEGLTTVTREDDRPAEPDGYRFCGDYYEIRTTAEYRGPVKIAFTYGDEDVSPGEEDSLSLDRFDKATGKWKDIPTSLCTEAHIVCGEVASL